MSFSSEGARKGVVHIKRCSHSLKLLVFELLGGATFGPTTEDSKPSLTPTFGTQNVHDVGPALLRAHHIKMQFSKSHLGHGLFDPLIVTFQSFSISYLFILRIKAVV